MTVTTSLNYVEYQADGKSTTFTISFLLLDSNDLMVFLDGKLVTSGYKINGIGNPKSEIVFDKAPEGLLLLKRFVALTRETDYQENGDLLAKTINRDFDRIYLAMQGFDQDIAQTLRVKDEDGIEALPVSSERANKTLSFDSAGKPLLTVTATGSASELTQKLADASDSNHGANLVGYNKELNYTGNTVGHALNTLSKLEGNGVPLFAVFWWPSRASIPTGYVAADGQELSQAIFPDAATGIQQGQVPTVQETEWQTDPLKRGSYVANSSQGMFRIPDYNGKYQDSLGALFLRGDNGTVVSGEIQKDGMGTAKVPTSYSPYGSAISAIGFQHKNRLAAAFTLNGDTTGWNSVNYTITAKYENNYVNFGNEETRPINVTGCWIIKLFGYVINSGEADIQQLITENTKLAARLSLLEGYQQAKRFTIIYPNGGTKENPANITANKRYVMDNPFSSEQVICLAELYINNLWGPTGFIYSNDVGGRGGYGTLASQTSDNKIVIQTGGFSVVTGSPNAGGPHQNVSNLSTAPCRVKVWRVI